MGWWRGRASVTVHATNLELGADLLTQLVELCCGLARKHLRHVGAHSGVERTRKSGLAAVPTAVLELGHVVLAQRAQGAPKAPTRHIELRAPAYVLE